MFNFTTTYDQSLKVLGGLKDNSRVLIDSLITFRDAVSDIITLFVSDSASKPQTDFQQNSASLYIIANSATVDFDILGPVIQASTPPSYENKQKLQNLGSNLSKHARDIYKLLDHINGREDWSSLATDPSLTAIQRMGRPEKRVSFNSRDYASRRSRSSVSPQSVTVEEVTDLGFDEPNPQNEHYYMQPETVGCERRLSSRNSLNHHDTIHDGRLYPQDPPQVFVRQPTDPNALGPLISSLDLDAFDHRPSRRRDSPLETESPMKFEADSSVHESDLEVAIRKHRHEIKLLKEELASSSSSSPDPFHAQRDKGKVLLGEPINLPSPTSKPRHSLYLGDSSSSHVNAYNTALNPNVKSRPSRVQRPRSSTASTIEGVRRPTIPHNKSDGATARYPSPRYSPGSSKEYSPPPPPRSSLKDTSSSQSRHRDSTYGLPHNTSLPAVLEQSHATVRDPEATHLKRASWAPHSDFKLFDQDSLVSSNSSTARPPLFRRPRSNSPKIKALMAQGDIRQDLDVSVEDLFHGAHKRVQVYRTLEDEMSGKLRPFHQVIDVFVMPGLRIGGRITLPDHGNWIPSLEKCGDLIFRLVEKPSENFEIQGRSVYTRITISLLESLVGWKRTIPTICGKRKDISINKCTPQGHELLIGDYGLPEFRGKDKEPGPRGEMYVIVDVKWPTNELDASRKSLIKQALVETYRSPRRRL